MDTSVSECTDEARRTLRSAVRNSMQIPPEVIVILFVGKLSPVKAPHMPIMAIKRFTEEQRRNIHLIFVGDGQLRHGLAHLGNTDPRVSCSFVGFKNQSELSPYYHAADLLVLPSVSEPWGLVVNEAMHHGLPCVVSSAVGSAADLVQPESTGEVFETGSMDSLVSTLLDAFALIGRSDIRANCRSVVSGYSVEKAALGIAEAYEKAIAKSEQTEFRR